MERRETEPKLLPNLRKTARKIGYIIGNWDKVLARQQEQRRLNKVLSPQEFEEQVDARGLSWSFIDGQGNRAWVFTRSIDSSLQFDNTKFDNETFQDEVLLQFAAINGGEVPGFVLEPGGAYACTIHFILDKHPLTGHHLNALEILDDYFTSHYLDPGAARFERPDLP